MTVDPEFLKQRIEDELGGLTDTRVLSHIRGLLVEPRLSSRRWDYGPDPDYPCWVVLDHAASGTGIGYSEFGFGPRSPWGLIDVGEDEEATSMGMDSGWFPFFLDAYFESHAPTDLALWSVFSRGAGFACGPLSAEESWADSWRTVERFKADDPSGRYYSDHAIADRRWRP